MLLSVAWKKICLLEAKSAWLYGFYAEIFDNMPEVKSLFLQLREEELVHFNQASLHLRLVNQNYAHFKSVDVEIGDIDELISRIESHVNDGVFEVLDALEFATALEENSLELQMRTIAGRSDPDLEKLCELMHTSDDGHAKRIRSFMEQWKRAMSAS